MTRDLTILARRQAERMVKTEELGPLPINPIAVAEAKGIVVERMPSSARGLSGMLMHASGNFGIAYATHVDNEGFQRFAVGHELGHFCIEGHVEAVTDKNGQHRSNAGFTSPDRYEREADNFAVGLLMPGALFAPAMERHSGGFETVKSLAELCATSLTTTAIRYTELTDQAVVAVLSEGDTIDFAAMSPAFSRLKGFEWLRRGSRVPPKTTTAVFSSDTTNVELGRHTNATCWLPEWFGEGPDIELFEDVVGLGNYGKTLTLLWADDFPDEDDEDEDAIGAFEPTFHRSRRR